MSLKKHLVDFDDFLRFPCNEMLQNSDFFEWTDDIFGWFSKTQGWLLGLKILLVPKLDENSAIYEAMNFLGS